MRTIFSLTTYTYPLIIWMCSSGTVGNSGHKWMLFIHSSTSKMYHEKCYVKCSFWQTGQHILLFLVAILEKLQQVVSYLSSSSHNCVSWHKLLRFMLGQKVLTYTFMLKHHLNKLICYSFFLSFNIKKLTNVTFATYGLNAVENEKH